MGREQRDTGVREEALGRRHVAEGGGGVGAERQDERRPGRVAGVVAVLDDAARVRGIFMPRGSLQHLRSACQLCSREYSQAVTDASVSRAYARFAL